MFQIFLFFYSLFLGNIFYRNENKLAGIKITDLVIKDDKIFFPKEFSPDDLEGGIGKSPWFWSLIAGLERPLTDQGSENDLISIQEYDPRFNSTVKEKKTLRNRGQNMVLARIWPEVELLCI